MTLGASAAQIACTPSSGFSVCYQFTYSGADQTIAIPAGITSVDVRSFGAAGGGANLSWYTGQGGGAGGGYAKATVAVSGAPTLTIVVGQGGLPTSTASAYGGGGPGGGSTQANTVGGGGGGMSAIFNSAAKTAGAALVVSGGGGGASPGADGSTTTGGGGGGGTTGGQGAATWNGFGGTQVAGGTAGAGTSACATTPTAGSQFLGGSGAASTAAGSHEGGGGGGGGYFGGGGGLCQSGATQNGGGGGGSSFTGGTGVTAGSTAVGSNFLYSGGACAGTSTSGGAADPYYTSGVGVGSCYGNGGNGLVVIQYALPTLTLIKISNGNVGAFSFTGTNGWASQTITTLTSGAGITGAKQVLTAVSASTAITETPATGFVLASATCTNMGVGGSASLVGNTLTLNSAATAQGKDVACTFTNTKTPTFKLQKTTIGGFGGPFSFTQTNLAATPGNINTAAAATPTPVSPAATNVSTIGTNITVSEGIASGFFFSAASCTDSNSAITGNTGSFGGVAGSTLTVPAARVVAGADFTCVFNNTKASPLLQIIKTPSTPGPVGVGTTITYTYTVKNIGNVTMTAISVGDVHNGSGAFNGPNTETLVTDVAPLGDSTDATVNGTWDQLGVGDTIKFSATYLVTQNDIDTLQ